MSKTLTISLSDEIYETLQINVGCGKMGKFIEHLIKAKLKPRSLDDEYKIMAQDMERESEATEWSNNLIGDIPNTTW